MSEIHKLSPSSVSVQTIDKKAGWKPSFLYGSGLPRWKTDRGKMEWENKSWRRNNEREYKDGRERKSSCINLDVDASRLGLIRKWRFHGKTSRGHISSFKYREKAKEMTEKIRFALIAFLDMDTYFGSTTDCLKIWIFCLFCVYQCYYPVRTFLFFFLKDFCIRKFLLLEIAAICCS